MQVSCYVHRTLNEITLYPNNSEFQINGTVWRGGRTVLNNKTAPDNSSDASRVTLDNCDREQIHIPGSVQSFGALIACQKDLKITRVSNNIVSWLNQSPQDLIGKPINTIFDQSEIDAIICSQGNSWQSKPLSLDGGGENKLHAICHTSTTDMYFDLLPKSDPDCHSRFQASVVELSKALSGTNNEKAVAQLLADTVHRLSGFDRVKVYKFDKDWHGEVIAEAKVDSVPSYLGLHFPQSDIPKQARELYKRNKVRVIGDVNDPQAPLIELPGLKPLDMSFSFIRSVSPIHLQYLRNMMVSSSMSLSLFQDKKFWGLIACHHTAPRTFTFEEADFFNSISVLGSNRLTDLYRMNFAIQKAEYHDQIQKMIANVRRTKDIRGLVNGNPSMNELIYSTGTVVILNGQRVAAQNAVPDQDTLNMLIHWLEHDHESLVAYDDLPDRYSNDIGSYACGVLAARIPDLPSSWLLWFRFEVAKEVSWAGDPFKPDSNTAYGERLYPRTSFELWKEIKRGHSLPWQQCEIDAAEALSNGLSNSASLEKLQQ